MRKYLKMPISVIMILLVMILNMTSVCAYDESDVTALSVSRSNSYPYPSISKALSINTSWKELASSTDGFNCYVYIVSYNTSASSLTQVVASDIQMLDANGNVIWYESGAVSGSGSSRIFFCGSDVYSIQIRTQIGKGTAFAYETTV